MDFTFYSSRVLGIEFKHFNKRFITSEMSQVHNPTPIYKKPPVTSFGHFRMNFRTIWFPYHFIPNFIFLLMDTKKQTNKKDNDPKTTIFGSTGLSLRGNLFIKDTTHRGGMRPPHQNKEIFNGLSKSTV